MAAYVPNYGGNWQTGAGGGTPITEAALDNLETQYACAAADLIAKSTLDAHSIIMAVLDNTPVVLTVAASRIVGRAAAGNIDDLTPAQVMAILSGQAGADFSMNTHKITSVTDPGANQDAATKKYVDDNDVDATKEFFTHFLDGTGTLNNSADYLVYDLDALQIGYTTIKVPHDFTALTHCKVICFHSDTENIDWTVETDFASEGEANNTHTDSDTANAVAMTASQIASIDISNAFTGIVASDYVGVKFTLDTAAAGILHVMGIVFKYS